MTDHSLLFPVTLLLALVEAALTGEFAFPLAEFALPLPAGEAALAAELALELLQLLGVKLTFESLQFFGVKLAELTLVKAAELALTFGLLAFVLLVLDQSRGRGFVDRVRGRVEHAQATEREEQRGE